MENVENIIFLDFDGVLNIFIQNNESWDINYPSDGCLNNIDAIKYLNELHDEVNYSIVITSSWRYIDKEKKFSFNCSDILYNSGLNANINILGNTPMLDTGTREDEIKAWLEDNNYNNKFLIIDDEDNPFSKLKEHLILCDPEFGLTEYEMNDIESAFKSRSR